MCRGTFLTKGKVSSSREPRRRWASTTMKLTLKPDFDIEGFQLSLLVDLKVWV